MSPSSGTRITGVGTVAIAVADQTTALGFYVDTLGFEIRLDVPFGDGGRWIEVAPPGAETTVAIVAPGEHFRVGVDTGVRFSTTDAEADHKDLVARRVDVDPEVMRWPGVPPMFSLRDLDGNTLYIVER
jgi:catechol 2,3-dioxygenase-like lactoylglutathione lyase family enzyme